MYCVQAVFEALGSTGLEAVMMAVTACGSVRNAEKSSNGRMTEACRKFGHAMKGLDCDVAARAQVAMLVATMFGDLLAGERTACLLPESDVFPRGIKCI